MLLQVLDKLCHRPGLPLRVVIVAVEHFLESPLGPVVILRVASAYFAVPIEAKSDFIQLFAVAVDILDGRNGRMLPRLDGILLGREPIRVVTHRMQDVEAPQPLVAGIYIRRDIAQRMPNVQSRARRIGKHIQDIIFRPCRILFHPVNLVGDPVFAPFFLNFSEIVIHNRMMFIVFSYYPEIKTCKGTESFGMPPRKTLFSLQKSILQF